METLLILVHTELLKFLLKLFLNNLAALFRVHLVSRKAIKYAYSSGFKYFPIYLI
jgi:hypothetical protein